MSMIFNDLKESDDDFCFGGYMNALPIQKKNTDIEELKAYRAIGTVSEFRELKEKATAKKVWLYVGSDMKCPSCGMRLRNYEGVRNPYCKFCGQQLER